MNLCIFSLLAALISTSVAFADQTVAQNDARIFKPDESLFRGPASENEPRKEGWDRNLTLTGNLSFTSSEDVVGQTNGTSQTYGTNVKGSLYNYGLNHEWRNEIFVRGATTKTASIPRFVKTDDELKLNTIYLYFLPSLPQVGPYARAEAAAPMFRGEDVRSDVKTYRFLREGQPDRTYTGTSTRLTDAFRPLTTKEAVGFFYRPVWNDRVHLETRLGFAGQQIAAGGQLAVKGVNTAGEVEITELKSVRQAGLEAGASIRGKIDEKSSYEVGADLLTPFINDKPANDRRDAWRLTNVDAYAKLTSKVTDWMSFGYDYKLKIQPQLVDRTQQIHMLVINFTYPVIPGKL